MLSSTIITALFIFFLGGLLWLLRRKFSEKSSHFECKNEKKPSSKVYKEILRGDSSIPPETTENSSKPDLNGTPDPREKN